MSSTVSATELKTIPPRAVAKLQTEEKPRLVRTSSIEKIRRFNTFICSHQYYILPALLSWLKSSQSGLQSSTEKTIFLFRSVLFNTFFYKLYQMWFRSAASGGRNIDKLQRDVGIAIASVIFGVYRKCVECLQSTVLMVVVVYSACVLVLCQMFVALYLIYFSFLPYGFIFMIGCMASIKYFCYRTMVCAASRHSRRDIRNK